MLKQSITMTLLSVVNEQSLYDPQIDATIKPSLGCYSYTKLCVKVTLLHKRNIVQPLWLHLDV